jgi:glycerol uptake operon antiterminator
MIKKDILRLMQRHPVAAAIRSEEDREIALSSNAALLFLLKGDPFTITNFVTQAHKRDKGVVIHLDLMSGIGKDRAGIQYLKQKGIDAIITSKTQLVAAGKAEGLATIQRLLLLDNSALDAGIKTVTRSNPDIIEILPGIIFPDIAPQLLKVLAQPLITGGFIHTKEDVSRASAAGALLCSSSTKELWF